MEMPSWKWESLVYRTHVGICMSMCTQTVGKIRWGVRTDTHLLTQSHIRRVHTTQEQLLHPLETISCPVGGKGCWLVNHWKPGQGEVE